MSESVLEAVDGEPVIKLVGELNGYQPIDADLSQAFFESRTQTLELRTVASDTLKRLVELPGVRLVVLTGNAGHGKTHLCARLLSDLPGGGEFKDASTTVITLGDGQCDVHMLESGRPLRIVKDLSEFSHLEAIELLRAALLDDAVTVVCANEGRLRYCVQKDSARDNLLAGVEAALKLSFSDGGAVTDAGTVAVLNLNFQSVAGGADGQSLVERTLTAWLEEPDWRDCASCLAVTACPIRANFEALQGDGQDAVRRRAVIRRVFEVAEQCGTVVTVREMLIVLSHALTGGLSCHSVRTRLDTQPAAEERGEPDPDFGWQSRYLYHQLLFSPQVLEQAIERSRTFKALQRLDPGARALRQVDDAVDPFEASSSDPFAPACQELKQAPPKTGAHRESRDRIHRSTWKFYRRRLLFEAIEGDDVQLDRRLGIEWSSEFDTLTAGGGASIELRKVVANCLAAIQGYRSSSSHNASELPLMDPAFVEHRSMVTDQAGAAGRAVARVVAKKVGVLDLRLSTKQSPPWAPGESGEDVPIRELLDWTERSVVLEIAGTGDAGAGRIAIGLAEFDYLLRVGGGLEARAAFSPTARKVLRFLADHARGSTTHGFSILTSDKELMVVVEDGRLVGL